MPTKSSDKSSKNTRRSKKSSTSSDDDGSAKSSSNNSSLEDQLLQLKNQMEEMQSSHQNEISQMKSLHAGQENEIVKLKAALKASHYESVSSNSNLQTTMSRELNLVHRMALELHALCSRNEKKIGEVAAEASQKQTQQRNNNYAAVAASEEEVTNLLPQQPYYEQTNNDNNRWEIIGGKTTSGSNEQERFDFSKKTSSEGKHNDIENVKSSKQHYSEQQVSEKQNKDDDNADFGREFELAQDSFSLMMIGRIGENGSIIPMLTGWGVFCFQIVSFVLILWNIVDSSNTENPFGFPTNVHIGTRMAEFVAIMITVACEEDSREAVVLWNVGYTRSIFHTPSGTNITKVNWYLSVITRGFMGFFDLFMTFLLIMKSEEVVDLLLNFTAMEFVAHLDDIAFGLAVQGFLGRSNREMAEEVCGSSYSIIPLDKLSNDKKKNCCGFCNRDSAMTAEWWRVVVFVSVLVALLTGWATIYGKQEEGLYSCKTVFFQFDDSLRYDLSGLSGKYLYAMEDGQITYYLESPGAGNMARFKYCGDDASWTLSSNNDLDNHCDDWIIRSDSNELSWTDISLSAADIWFFRSGDRQVIMERMRIFCVDCNKEDYCGDHGACEEEFDRCICDDGYYGLRCDFEEPCPTIEVDTRSGGFTGFRLWSNTYSILKTKSDDYVNVNWHPVYVNQKESSEFDIILFTGRRWMLTSSIFMRELEGNITEQRLIRYLKDEFRVFWSDYTLSFLSDPVDVDTATDAATPIGTMWYNGGIDTTLDKFVVASPVYTNLLCIHCDNSTNPCNPGGQCRVDDNRCDCSLNGASGSMCQIPPIGNGFCNPFFNTAQFDYDGGDCCQATCKSTEFTCGQYKEYPGYKGYCDCTNPDHTCPENENFCWLPYIESIYGERDSAESGRSLALSADASVVAIGEPGSDSVRVFTTDGSNWVKVGETISGETGSSFGYAVALSGDATTLAVGSTEFTSPNHGDFRGLVCIFEISDNIWTELDRTPIFESNEGPIDEYLKTHGIVDGSFGSSLALNQYGSVVFISIPYSRQGASPGIIVFERNETSQKYFQSNAIKADVPVGEYYVWGKSISVSASGQSVAFDAVGFGSTKVLVYKYTSHNDMLSEENSPLLDSNSSRSYQILGSPIPGAHGLLSSSGRVLVVTSEEDPVTCQVYHWESNDGLTGKWASLGSPLNGTAKALSSDGSIVAVAGADSHIHTYRWKLTRWQNIGHASGSGEASVILSGGKSGSGSDNVVMAIGLPFAGGASQGRTTLYHLNTNSEDAAMTCKDNNAAFRLELSMDSPNETIWEVRDHFTQKLLLAGGPYNATDPEFISKTYQLPSTTSCAEFTIFDLGGNGICCESGFGFYSIYFGGVLQQIGGNFDWLERKAFGDCEHSCPEGESLFSLQLTTDDYPTETSWVLIDEQNGQQILDGGPYDAQGTDYIEEACFPSNMCASFTMKDGFGDGLCCSGGFGSYKASWAGSVILSGAEFAHNETATAGDCASGVQAVMSQMLQTHPLGLVINVTVEPIPFELEWFIYDMPFAPEPLLRGNLYNDRNTIFGNQFVQIDVKEDCYAFEMLASKGNGNIVPFQYSLFLDEEEIVHVEKFDAHRFYLIGSCADVKTTFNLVSGNSITCSDAVHNSCEAPASCAANGLTIEAVGEHALGIALESNEWETAGAYSLQFGNECKVACVGSCSTPEGCRSSEIVLRVALKATYFSTWDIESYQNSILSAGSIAAGDIISEQICIPKDACTIFKVEGDSRFSLYLDGEHFATDITKNAFAAQNICPDRTNAFNIETTSNSISSLLPLDCTGDADIAFNIQITVSDKTSWNLVDERSNETLVEGGPYLDASAWMTTQEGHCIPSDACTILRMHNFKNYSLYLGGDRFANGDATTSSSSLSIHLGRCASTGIPEKIQESSSLECDEDRGENCVGSGDNATNTSYAEPSSNGCRNAEPISLDQQEMGSTSNATVAFVPNCGDARSSASQGVWYSIVGNGEPISATLSGLDYDAQISVFSGTCDSLAYSLSCVAGNDDTEQNCSSNAFDMLYASFSSTNLSDSNVFGNVDFPVSYFHPYTPLSYVQWDSVSDVNYFILVHGYGTESGEFALTLERPVFNDLCDDADVLLLNTSVFGSTFSSTIDDVVPCGETIDSSSRGVWYSVTGTGNYLFASLFESCYDTKISVFSGSCDSLICVASNDNYMRIQSRVGWSSTLGTTYLILVHGKENLAGIYSLIVTEESPAPNDICNGATTLAVNGASPATVTDSTYFSLFDDVPSCGLETGDNPPGVWYSVETTESALFVSNDGNLNIQVFQGSCDVLECVTRSSQYHTTNWTAISGVAYFIHVQGYSSQYTLMVAGPARNDDCVDAIALAMGSSTTGSTAVAALDNVTADCGNAAGGETYGVWYTVIGTGRTIIASLCDSEYDTILSVFTGASCSSLQCEGYNDDSSNCYSTQSEFVWPSISGTTYFILVHGFGGATGSYSLNLTQPDPHPGCINANSLSLSGANNNQVTGLEFNDAAAAFLETPSCAEASENLSLAVWYSLTPNNNAGQVVAKLWCEPFSDVHVAVFSGICDSLACEVATVHACDLANYLTWNPVTNATYHLVVNGDLTGGSYSLDVAEISHTNNVCTDAIPLELDERIYSSTTWALGDKSVGKCGNSTEGISPGVWFSVDGTGNNMEASTCYVSSFDVQISIFSGNCDERSCVTGVQSCSVTWSSIVDTTYYIYIHGDSNATYAGRNVGDFALIVYDTSHQGRRRSRRLLDDVTSLIYVDT